MIQQAIRRVKYGHAITVSIPMIAAFLTSTIRFGGFSSPIGIALCIACGRDRLLSVAFGSALGYLIPFFGGTDVPMVCGILVALSLRYMSKSYPAAIGERILWSSLAGAITFLPLAIYCAVASLPTFTLVVDFGLALLSGGFCYMSFDIDSAISMPGFNFSKRSRRERYGIILYGVLCIAALMPVKIGVVSLGRMLGGGAVMSLGVSLGGLGGACGGLALALGIMLPQMKDVSLAMAAAFTSVGTGIFGRESKWFALLSWTIFYIFLCGGEIGRISALMESIGAGLIMFAMPILSKEKNRSDDRDLRLSVDGKLQSAGMALGDVATMVERVAGHLRKRGEPTVDKVYTGAQDRVCVTCKKKLKCYGESFSEVDKSFLSLTSVLDREGKVEGKDFPQYFVCDRREQLANEITNGYRKMKKEISMRKYMVNSSGVNVPGELMAMSGLMEDLRMQLDEIRRPDPSLEGIVTACLLTLDVHPVDIRAFIDRNDRATVMCRTVGEIPGEQLLVTSLSEGCSRHFCPPIISRRGDEITLTFCEEAMMKISAGGVRIPGGENKYCGDDFVNFSTENGFFISAISDGMGSGDLAAIDGSLTCSMISKLMKTGFSVESVLSIVNASLMAKGGDESFSTIDMCKIDSFTGDCTICKGGAAPTLIFSGDGIERVEIHSLPLGILPNVECAYKEIKLREGDMVIMMSDGVWNAGEASIKKTVMRNRALPPSLLSRELVRMSKSSGIIDDMTAVVLKVEKV